MNIWISVLLAWVAVNLVLVALMWRYQAMKERSAREREDARAPEAGTGSFTREQRKRLVAFASADVATSIWAGTAPRPQVCDTCTRDAQAARTVQDLQDEIRILKFTVAELALEKAMLTSAAARRKALS
jgi:hypothetical protein